MKIRKSRKKKEESIITPIEEIKDEEIKEEEKILDNDSTTNDEEIEDKEIKAEPEAIIEEPIKEEETLEVSGSPVEVGDFVILIEPKDYKGNEVEEKKIYRVDAIHGDKAQLKVGGLLDISTRLDNLIKVSK